MFGRKRLETGPFLDGETKKRGNERGRGGGGEHLKVRQEVSISPL